MSNGPGFYKNDNGGLFYAAEAVTFPSGAPLVAPGTVDAAAVQGWQWFNAEADARAAYGLPAPVLQSGFAPPPPTPR